MITSEDINKGTILVQRGKPAEAIEYFDQLMGSGQEESNAVLCARADALIAYAETVTIERQKKGLLEKAKKDLTKVTDADCLNDNAFLKLGEVEKKIEDLSFFDSTSTGSRRSVSSISKKNASSRINTSTTTADSHSQTLVTVSGKTCTYNDNEKIGSGGFAVVYRGTWSNQPVAIKHIQGRILEAKSCRNFLLEAGLMMKFESPFLLKCHDIISVPGHYCLVTDYMARGSLYKWLHDNTSPFNYQQQVQVAKDITRGLQVLHDENIVHRDLKSENILIDLDYRAKLADFGLAEIKKEASQAASHTNVAGTLKWLAPEVFQHRRNHNKASDIYSLGMVLWEIVTRLRPYAGKNDLEVEDAKRQNDHEKIPANCPARFSFLISQCWKLPHERPTAQDLVESWEKPESKFVGRRESEYGSLYSGGANFQLYSDSSHQVAQSIMPAISPAKFPSVTLFQPSLSPSLMIRKNAQEVADEVTPEEISVLLNAASKGELKTVKYHLKRNHYLLFAIGSVIDVGNRRYTDITVLQYAFIIGDIAMCKLIIKQFDKDEEKAIAYQISPESIERNGVYSLEPVITAYRELEKNYLGWSYEQRKESCWKVIGGHQKEFPMYIRYEMTERGTDAPWCQQGACGEPMSRDHTPHERDSYRIWEKYHDSRVPDGQQQLGVSFMWARPSTNTVVIPIVHFQITSPGWGNTILDAARTSIKCLENIQKKVNCYRQKLRAQFVILPDQKQVMTSSRTLHG